MKRTVILSLIALLFMMIPGYVYSADCTLDDSWMEAESEWTSWAYLKMTGEITDYYDESIDAVTVDGRINLSKTTKTFSDGSFMNYNGSIILANVYVYVYTNVNESAGTATVDYWDAMYQFSPGLIPAMKEQEIAEAGFGSAVFLRHSFIDIEYNNESNKVTADFTRKNCYIGLSKMEEVEDGGDVYDVPIGDMYGCFDGNVDGSAGEELNMMFKNELTEDEAAMLKFFNTRSDGSVAVYGEDDFDLLCVCYEADGETEVNCWNEYDGPGGAEDCPAVVEAAGDCGTIIDPDDDPVGGDSDSQVFSDEDSNEKADDDIENLTDTDDADNLTGNDETNLNDTEHDDTETPDTAVSNEDKDSNKSGNGCSAILLRY